MTTIHNAIAEEGRATFNRRAFRQFFAEEENSDKYYAVGPYKVGKTTYISKSNPAIPIFILYCR